jgi:ribosome maturation factor RimP
MEKAQKIESLREILRPAIENHGAFLVDVSLAGDNRRPLLEVFCETESGISIDQCAEISRNIMPMVDSSKIIGDNFRLEVSSPGIGVPLKDRRQFKRNVGRRMMVKYHDGLESKQIEGDVTEVGAEKIVIRTKEASTEIGFDSIDEAVVKIRW